MTSFNHFVTIFSLFIIGSSLVVAADDAADTGSAAASTATGDEATPTTTHHKRHHKTGSTAATNAVPVAAATPPPAAPTAGVSGSKGASTPRKSVEPAAPPPTETAVASAAPSAATAAPSTSATHHSRHHHAATAVAATNAPPLVPNATGGKTPVAGTVPPSTPGTPAGVKSDAADVTTAATAAAATTAKGRHHRHGKTAAKPALPQPPIIVAPTPVPSLPPAAPATATLPTPPPVGEPHPTIGNVPTVQTGLPIARPGAGTTATLPIAPIHTASLFNFPFHDYPQPHRHTQIYPWKTSIVTTVFWVGEPSTPLSGATNKMSAWDMNWVHNNGGADDQNDMSGYASADHASTLNPFYVALPFNDLAYPEKTERWLPSGWDRSVRRNGKPVSACQGRWIEIKNRAGRVCFAQWEDVGPVVTDDAEYVFGGARPSAYQGRGLDVSPAVAKYLGIDSTAYTSWRFVDDNDVLPGMWLRYDEQALLFRAIIEKLHGSPNPRIQDLNEPVADPSDDSNQKKAGAARG